MGGQVVGQVSNLTKIMLIQLINTQENWNSYVMQIDLSPKVGWRNRTRPT